MITTAGNYMDSDAWAAWMVGLILVVGSGCAVLAWAAGRRGGGRRG